MPALARLAFSNLRNVLSAELDLAPAFNLFFGDNGSGKTTVLEAVYLLAMGRSFRGHLQRALVTEGQNQATVFGLTDEGLSLGVARPLRGAQTVKIAGRKAEGLAELSQALPVQLINSDTFQILEGSPSERRRFLDWGVFHVEHQFLSGWRRMRVALQNRNSLLRQEAGTAEIEPWTLELARSAELMDRHREAYIRLLKAVLEPQLARLEAWNVEGALVIDYLRGWDADSSLYEQLQRELPRDRKLGHTSSGPHRADLRFRFGNTGAADFLSRGQLKLLICVLKIAQAQLLRERMRKRCVFLIDDLPAELDQHNRNRVCSLLSEQGSQVLLTAIERETLAPLLERLSPEKTKENKLFHVKHGKIMDVGPGAA